MSRKRHDSGSSPPNPSTLPGGSKLSSTGNKAIKALTSGLNIMRGGLEVFPPLKNAVDELIGCTKQLQIADHSGREYEQLASTLATLAQSLQVRLSQSRPTHMPFTVENVARAISEQARHIQMWQDRAGTRRMDAAKDEDDDILKCYHRVMVLFEQLQTDVSLSIWDIVHEEKVETRLQRLSPAKDAWYNSALSVTMTKRRACTANTRTVVLADAHTWARDDKGAKIYWMNGMAGTGKTTIAYSLCKRLEEDKQLGASFFCSRDSPTCREVTKLVPTIAYQLGRYSIPYRQAVCAVLSKDPDVIDKDIEAQFENLIAKPLKEVKKAMPTDVVVVIDALDELADITGTQQALNLLFRHTTELSIKFFVTSRPEPAIVTKMTQENSSSRLILHLHDIEQSFIQADIRTYLTEALSPIQPSTDQIEQLTVQAGRLFIFAATVVRYISPDDESADHEDRLLTMLDASPNHLDQNYADIDKLYSMILLKAFQGGTAKETELRRLVLRTVVCAGETMTMSALAEILGAQNERKVELATKPLRSVLHVSQSAGHAMVSTLHASFPDFLLNEERAGSLCCNGAKHNSYLATRCFDVMKHSLRFNICELETSYRFDRDVPGLQSRIDSAITSGLFYACRYWGDHLLRAGALVSLQHLNDFLRCRLLFWVEVLSLKGWIGHGEGILSQALSWLPTDDTLTELRQFTYDARNFVTTYASTSNPTSLSTPHIYLSALPFTPIQSHVRTNYWPRTRGLLRVEGTGMEARGEAALATWKVGSLVRSIAQSGDAKHIVSSCDDGTVSIWDTSNGARIVGPLNSGERGYFGLKGVAFSFDGTRIASGFQGHTIRIWDAHNGNPATGPLTGQKSSVLSVAFSPDGTRLISGSRDRTIRMWDARNGGPFVNTFQGHRKGVLSVVFSPDGKRIASGSIDHTIRIWDVRSAMTIVGPLKGHSDLVFSVAFSPDGLRVVSGSNDQTVRVWDVQSGSILADPFRGHTNMVLSVAFSPDGMRVVSGSRDRTIRIWDAQSGALIASPLDGHHDSVTSVLFSTDGTRILSGSNDCTIRVWDARLGPTAACAARSSGHTDVVCSVAFSPDGTRVVSGSADRTIRVWDTRDGRLVVGPLKGHIGSVYSVAFSPNGAQIVSGSNDCTVCTWDARSGSPIAGPFEGQTGAIWSVAYSPDGRRIVSGSVDRMITVWDSQTGKLAAEPFMGHTRSVTSVAWSPDGTRIVSGSWDKTVRMWSAHDGTELWMSKAPSDEVNCVAYSPDGTRVVSGSEDQSILVLNADDGAELLGPFKGHTGSILSVAFLPHGNHIVIVSGSFDQTVCVWDVQKGTLVSGPFKGHTGDVRSVAFSPDGRRVVSCSNDKTIRFWPVATADNPLPTYLGHYTLRDDGWVTDSNSQLLMWLPPDLRDGFPLPACSGIIRPGGTIFADYTDLLVGERWSECYYDIESTTTTGS